MERRVSVSDNNFDGGLNTLICQEDLYDEEHPPSTPSKQKRVQVSMSNMALGRHAKLAAVILVLLAAVLLIVDISLGVHSDGCRHCPTGWILMNMACYYFPFSVISGFKTWYKARAFCQTYGGDLIVIDSKDKENATVNLLRNNVDRSKPINGFWIGLRDVHEEGTWKWLDGTVLIEGYWNDDEPNDIDDEDCAAVYPRENFFKAWNDVSCSATMKWICEKAL
ncbi:C-type lectin lectoxin-Phi1-like isoform X2 [Seriola dumerili]|uniref:C-type lectin lectoxin-Phi1-like isoform X2 n=1 Tax=Seriola dumerili TaxID=41447 RepID=UPI000BBE4B4E|nr:C-type lectin lectoxin-Phi1-like isoform X2 [Seriola dumerili]